MFSHWSDLQKYEVQWQDYRITMIAVERPKLVTTVQKTWEKECGQMQIQAHEARTSTTLSSVFWRTWVAYKHRTWVLGDQLSVRQHSRLQPVQAKSCLKQVHRKVVSRFADSKHRRLKFNNISYRRLLNSPQDVHLAQAHAKAARCSSCPRRGVVGGLVADAFFRWTLIV